MKTFETLMDVTETGDFLLPISEELKPGRYKVVLVVDEDSLEEDFPITDKQKKELQKRLNRIKDNPHPGYTKTEIIRRMEARIGRKLQI